MVPRRVVWVAAVGDGIVERSRSNKKRLTCLWWGTDSCCLRGVCSCHAHGLPMVPLSSSPLHDIGCGLNLVSCRCAFCVVHRAFPTCCSAMLSLLRNLPIYILFTRGVALESYHLFFISFLSLYSHSGHPPQPFLCVAAAIFLLRLLRLWGTCGRRRNGKRSMAMGAWEKVKARRLCVYPSVARCIVRLPTCLLVSRACAIS